MCMFHVCLHCCMPGIIIVSCSVLLGILSSDTFHKSKGHAWVNRSHNNNNNKKRSIITSHIDFN